LIIRISRDFCYRLYAKFIQLLKESDKKRIGILKASGIDELNPCLPTIIHYRVIVNTLTKPSQPSCAIVSDNSIIYIAASMACLREAIIAQMDFEAIFPQSFHLIMYLLTDAADIRKAMINKE
jgi:hypothetical protein